MRRWLLSFFFRSRYRDDCTLLHFRHRDCSPPHCTDWHSLCYASKHFRSGIRHDGGECYVGGCFSSVCNIIRAERLVPRLIISRTCKNARAHERRFSSSHFFVRRGRICAYVRTFLPAQVKPCFSQAHTRGNAGPTILEFLWDAFGLCFHPPAEPEAYTSAA